MTTKKTRGAGTINEGEVWDLAKVGKEKEAAARATLRLAEMPGTPGFLCDNLFSMLSHAAKVCDVPIGSEDPHGGYSVKQLAALFAVSELQRGGLTFEPERDLAALISGVMKHPDTPTELFNAIGEVLTDMAGSIDYHSPEMVGRTLAAAKKGEE
jgi:hypothetical protein